jgi:hypothetical protein
MPWLALPAQFTLMQKTWSHSFSEQDHPLVPAKGHLGPMHEVGATLLHDGKRAVARARTTSNDLEVVANWTVNHMLSMCPRHPSNYLEPRSSQPI